MNRNYIIQENLLPTGLTIALISYELIVHHSVIKFWVFCYIKSKLKVFEAPYFL